jgi:Ca2+-binding RTX toxin-like protein
MTKRNRDIICGGTGDDRIYSGTGRDQVYGEAGNDFIDEGPGSGKGWGGSGTDVMIGGGGGESFWGGDGDDRLMGEIQDDDMHGEGGNDLLIGGQGIDTLTGGSGDDWVRGDTNQDRFSGDDGVDTVSFATATPPGPLPTQDGVSVDLQGGVAFGDDSQEGPITGFENVVGSAFEDSIVGSGVGYIRGLGGADVCSGFLTAVCAAVPGGPTVYIANADSPDPGVVVFGGGGNDNLSVTLSGGAVHVTGSNASAGPGCAAAGGGHVACPLPGRDFGYVLLWGGEGDDTLSVGSGIPVTTGVKGDGGPGDDVLNGGPAADVLFPGESGSDRLIGGDGDDALAGRPGGADALVGGPGNDNLATDDACAGHTYDGGPGGADVAGFAQAGEGAGVVATLGGTGERRGAGACSPTSIQGNLEVLEGTRNGDVLTGNGGVDLIIGREGNDVLDGRSGRDELRGDGGNDRCPDGTAIKFSC